jgi:hypothetical protein
MRERFFTQEKITALLLSCLFSVLVWFITNMFIIDISLFQYLFIEILLLLLNPLYTFVQRKLAIPQE